MESSYVLNRERQELRVSVKSNLSVLKIKEFMEKAEKLSSCIYVSGDITIEPEGYSVYIRQKISLKEYLKSEVLDREIVYRFVCSLQELRNVCNKEKLAFYDFLFDFDAVFVDSVSNMEFVYFPGATFDKKENSISDIFLLLLMHCPREEVKLAEYLGELEEKFRIWEKTGGVFPEVSVDILPVKRSLGIWRKMCMGVSGSLFVALIMCFTNMSVFLWPLWAMVSSAVILYASPVRLKLLEVRRICYLHKGPDFNNGEITVGRDVNWADYCIENLMVSRRHAVVIQKTDCLSVRDLFSSNGTFIDEEKIPSGEEVDVVPGQTVSFGRQCGFCVKSKIKFLLK